MGWIAQAYEGDVHVVPDTEEGHVLSDSCWCAPLRDPLLPGKVVHTDEAERILLNDMPWWQRVVLAVRGFLIGARL